MTNSWSALTNGRSTSAPPALDSPQQALRAAVARHEKTEEEERQKAGYRRIPPTPQEFTIPDEDHAWGDHAWKDG